MAKDNPIVVHPEENFRTLCDVGTDAQPQPLRTEQSEVGEVEAELAAVRWCSPVPIIPRPTASR